MFLSQRDKPYARASVTEVGDFIAHRDVRVRGPATGRSRDFFLALRAFAPAHLGATRFTVVLSDAIAGCRAVISLVPEPVIISEMGFGKAAAQSMLGRMIAKELGLKKPLNAKEIHLLNFLSSVVHSKAIFTPDEIVSDLSDVLESAQLMLPAERPLLVQRQAFISLFVATKMHGSELTLDDGFMARLAIRHDPHLTVWAQAPISVGQRGTPIFGFPMFETGLLAEQHCASGLADPGHRWVDPIELNPNGLLDFIR